ncbi:MAG TPA: hypothetical protein VL485_12825 [Ktedonobacteraceae bacterium]|nr:hypothetical protein [Ktedonobacteraceae bacterium]
MKLIRPAGRNQTSWRQAKPWKGRNATSAEPAGSRAFPDAIPCLHGVPTGLGSGANGCDV